MTRNGRRTSKLRASAGPVRQIPTQRSASIPYAPSLTRRANCVNSYLRALSLVRMNIAVDLAKLMPNAACVADIRRYP